MELPGSKADVFISHATEDKENVARPLAKGLRRRRLAVWFDEFSLRPGDELQRSIEEGLRTSRAGVAVLSSAYFSRRWPRLELEALLGREAMDGKPVLIPVWHGVTHGEVYNYSPIVAGRYALLTSRGIRYVLRKIAEELRSRGAALVESSSRPRFDPAPTRLFTYGTAIALEQLGRYLGWRTERTQAAFLNPRIARLKDYQLTFSTPFGVEAPDRGVSNIERSPEAYLEGIVYDLKEGVLTELETTVANRYWFVPVEVELRDGAVLRSHTFIAKAPRSGLKPHRDFLGYMVALAKTAELDSEFVERLKGSGTLE
jgi:TIR domain